MIRVLTARLRMQYGHLSQRKTCNMVLFSTFKRLKRQEMIIHRISDAVVCVIFCSNKGIMISLHQINFSGKKSLQLEREGIPKRFKTNHGLLSSFEIHQLYFAVNTDNSSFKGYFFQRIKRRHALISNLLEGPRFRFFVEVLCGE